MAEIKQISLEDAKKKHLSKEALFIDIRDIDSFNEGHIDGAFHLSEDNLKEFLASADKNRCTIICCYHGNSSQGAAGYFSEQGFKEVYSLMGGYSAWQDGV